VQRDDIDDIVGFVHAKDLLRVAIDRRHAPIPAEFVRDLLVVPETRELTDLLADMRRHRRPFALVIDEYGGTSGITTIEDVLEELVGEISDEHHPAALGIVHLGADHYLAPGGLRVDQFADSTGFSIPQGDYHTLAGFVAGRLGRVPRPGDTIAHHHWTLTVRETRRHRAETLELTGPSATANPAQLPDSQ
jgi:CBS domain containing-hemolysin-like protein